MLTVSLKQGGSIELDSHITSDKKTLKIYPGQYHELMNELPETREIVLSDIKAFLDSVIPEKKKIFDWKREIIFV